MARIFITTFFILLGGLIAYGLYSEAVKTTEFHDAFPYWLGCASSIILVITIIFAYEWWLSILLIAMGIGGFSAGVSSLFEEPIIPFLVGLSLCVTPLYLSHRMYGRERPPELVDILLCIPFIIGFFGFIKDSEAGYRLIGGIVLFALGSMAIKALLIEKTKGETEIKRGSVD